MDASQVDVKGDIRFGRTTEPIEFWQMHARPFGTADASVAMYRGERGIEDPSSTAECREDFMIVPPSQALCESRRMEKRPCLPRR